MTNIASYVFSAYSFISDLPLDLLLNVGNQVKNGIPIPSFSEDILIQLCKEARHIFRDEDSLLRINGDLIVIGDIHGSFHDLLRILKYVTEQKSKVLFLGDYVDRGHFSLECITILFAMKVLRPNDIFLIRGNHEFDSICEKYGFKKEIINHHDPRRKKESKKLINNDDENISENAEDSQEIKLSTSQCYRYTEGLYRAFIKAFAYLPIASIVNGSTFCIHGGLSPLLEKVGNIDNIIRPIQTFEENLLLTGLVWSDPSSCYVVPYRYSNRGRGYLFNEDSVTNFLNENSLKRIIRAHQCVRNGVSDHFNKKCITVFSASSYACDMGNESGILKINRNNDSVQYVVFPPLRRLKKSDAYFYREFPKKSPYFSMRHPKVVFKGKTSKLLKDEVKSSSEKVTKNQRDFRGLKINCHVNPALIANNKKPSFPFIHVPSTRTSHALINKSSSMPSDLLISSNNLMVINNTANSNRRRENSD